MYFGTREREIWHKFPKVEYSGTSSVCLCVCMAVFYTFSQPNAALVLSSGRHNVASTIYLHLHERLYFPPGWRSGGSYLPFTMVDSLGGWLVQGMGIHSYHKIDTTSTETRRKIPFLSLPLVILQENGSPTTPFSGLMKKRTRSNRSTNRRHNIQLSILLRLWLHRPSSKLGIYPSS